MCDSSWLFQCIRTRESCAQASLHGTYDFFDQQSEVINYSTAVRRYQTALKHYCAQHAVELDRVPPLSRSAPLSFPDGSTEVSTSVVAESGGMALTPWAKHGLPQGRLGSQYSPHAANLACNSWRGRQWGAGRPRKCMPFRETFTRWFNSIRLSIDIKVMCRVPTSFLLIMARHV